MDPSHHAIDGHHGVWTKSHLLKALPHVVRGPPIALRDSGDKVKVLLRPTVARQQDCIPVSKLRPLASSNGLDQTESSHCSDQDTKPVTSHGTDNRVHLRYSRVVPVHCQVERRASQEGVVDGRFPRHLRLTRSLRLLHPSTSLERLAKTRPAVPPLRMIKSYLLQQDSWLGWVKVAFSVAAAWRMPR